VCLKGPASESRGVYPASDRVIADVVVIPSIVVELVALAFALPHPLQSSAFAPDILVVAVLQALVELAVAHGPIDVVAKPEIELDPIVAVASL
jgi:hypothetical protein